MTDNDTYPDWLADHSDCEWQEIPPCVYCKPHGVRLYQGTIPAAKDPELAARRAACPHTEHEMSNYGEADDPDWQETGLGFYWICAACGYRGWYE